MTIAGLQKTTLIDYPGKVACTVFLAGCNFRCPWCYSSELVLPEKIKKQPRISEKELFKFLKDKKGLLDGVVLCGGEPSLNNDLPEFIRKIRNLGFSVKLDTNGSNPKMLEELIKKRLVDYIAMDVKAPLGLNFQVPSTKYQKATGVKVDLGKIKKSVEIIKKSGIDYEFRTTVVPALHTRKDILEIAKYISESAPRLRRGFGGQGAYFLQNFRPEKTLNPRFKKQRPYSKEFLSEIKGQIAKYFKTCEVR